MTVEANIEFTVEQGIEFTVDNTLDVVIEGGFIRPEPTNVFGPEFDVDFD